MVMGLLNDVKVKVGSEKDCVQTVSVEMSNAKVNEHIEKAFKKVQSKVKIPGFRPGKSPIDVIKQKYEANAHAEAQESLLREGVAEALKQKEIKAVHTPVVQSVKFDPKKTFQFDFKVEVSPTFKLGTYKGLKLTKNVSKVTDKDLKDALGKIADSNAQLIESKATKLDKKHFAVVDYEAFMDEKPIKGAKTEGFLMDMSANQAIDGLAEGLLGSKPGEEKEIEVTFPKESPSQDLAGKKATFKVKLNAIKEKKVPELTDDFAKDLGLESLDQLKTRVKENIEKERELQSKRELANQTMDKLLENHKFKVPPTLVEKQFEYIKNRQTNQLMQQGVSKADIDKFIENIKIQMRQQAEKEIRVQYVLNSIAETEKIEVTDEEISTKIKAMAAQSGSKDPAGFEKMVRAQYLESVKSDTRDGKVIEWITNNAKIKEVSGGSK